MILRSKQNHGFTIKELPFYQAHWASILVIKSNGIKKAIFNLPNSYGEATNRGIRMNHCGAQFNFVVNRLVFQFRFYFNFVIIVAFNCDLMSSVFFIAIKHL